MKNIIKVSLALSVLLVGLHAQDNSLENMFTDGTVSGELRSIYTGYKKEKAGEADIYATAVGGYIKYELAELNGFSAALSVAGSYDLKFATGDEGVKQNSVLSSSDGDYTVLNEAYLNYRNGGLNFRAGRQLIDTPLADSDDYRMIANTFEAYIATYEISDFTFMVGNLQDFQGVDADLDLGWVETGNDGTWLASIVYSTDMFEANAWYYDIDKKLNAIYLDATLNYEINSDVTLSGSIQYLDENERHNSTEEATIYGALVELSAYGVGVSLAYNESDRKAGKSSFSGYGGGTLFTSMNIMILDAITADRDARAVVAGLSYEIGDASLFYAYGDFDGDADSTGTKEHVIEQNLGVEYSIIKDKLNLLSIYTTQKDREYLAKTDYDWDLLEIKISYKF